MHNIVRQRVLSTNNYGMSHPTLSDRLCSPWEKMACLARHRPIVCNPGPCRLATFYVVRKYVLFKRDDNMPHPSSFDRVCCPCVMMACHVRRRSNCMLSKGNDGMPCTISSVIECFPQTMMECHTEHCPIVYVLQGRRWHALCDTVR